MPPTLNCMVTANVRRFMMFYTLKTDVIGEMYVKLTKQMKIQMQLFSHQRKLLFIEIT